MVQGTDVTRHNDIVALIRVLAEHAAGRALHDVLLDTNWHSKDIAHIEEKILAAAREAACDVYRDARVEADEAAYEAVRMCMEQMA